HRMGQADRPRRPRRRRERGSVTPDELYEELDGRKLILHQGQLFFNTHSHEEALAWERRGAKIVPWYKLDQYEAMKARRAQLKIELPLPGWEIHVLPLLDPEWAEALDEEGEVNVA